MRKILALLALLASATPANAQAVQQSGNVTAGHAVRWTTNGVVQDAGTAADGLLTSLGVRASGTGICQNSAAPTSGAYQQLCLGVTTSGGGTISLQNFGTAPAQTLTFVINGVSTVLPSGGGTYATITLPLLNGETICASGTTGLLASCGWSALAAGQLLVGQTGGTLPIWRTVSGDATIDSAGVWLNAKLNGVSYPASPSTNTVPVVTSSNTITYQAVPVAAGGTAATTAAGARTNLGLGTMAIQNASAVAITGGTITGMPSPTASSDVANKNYVDSLATGLHVITPSRLATTGVLANSPTYANGASGVGATLTAGSNGALSVDSTLTVATNRVLVKNQAAPAQNGIYSVTTVGDGSNPYVLTRVTDFDTAAEMLAGSYNLITAGATLAGTSYVLDATVTTVGTTAATFTQFSANNAVISLGGLSGAIGLGTGLAISGTDLILSPAPLTGGGSSTNNALMVWDGTSGLVAKNPGSNLTFVTPVLKINNNAAALPAVTAGTLLQLGQADGTTPVLMLDSFAMGSVFRSRRANNTAASPTALANNDLLMSIDAYGYGATGYSTTGSSAIAMFASGTWTDTSHPSYIAWYTTPAASITAQQRMLLKADGTLQWTSYGAGIATTDSSGNVAAVSIAQGDTFYGSATGVLTALAKNTSATRYYSNTGTSNNPAWAQVNLSNGVTSTLPNSNLADMAQSTIKCRKASAGTGAPQDCTGAETGTIVGASGDCSSGLALTAQTPGDLAVTYSVKKCIYSKVGPLVVVAINLATASFTWSTASGQVVLTGLPFAANEDYPAIMDFQGITKAGYTSFVCITADGFSSVFLESSASGLGVGSVSISNLPSGGNVLIRCTLPYFTDS